MTLITRNFKKSAVGVAAAMCFGLLAVPAGASGGPTQPSTKVGVAVNGPLPTSVLDAKFLDQQGNVVSLRNLLGQTVIIVPFLTLCPDTCPFTAGNLLQLQSRLTKDKAKNVSVVAISVDPYRDGVARIKAYQSMIKGNFAIWTGQGATTVPVPPKNASGADSVGTGDVNANTAAVESFLGWQAQIVEEDTPASVDWMAPHKKLTYDVSHSDGFFVVNSAGTLRFVGTHAPQFHGDLVHQLYKFLNSDGKYTAKHPTKGGWTPTGALNAMSWVAGESL